MKRAAHDVGWLVVTAKRKRQDGTVSGCIIKDKQWHSIAHLIVVIALTNDCGEFRTLGMQDDSAVH